MGKRDAYELQDKLDFLECGNLLPLSLSMPRCGGKIDATQSLVEIRKDKSGEGLFVRMRHSKEHLAKLAERLDRLEPFQIEEVDRLITRLETTKLSQHQSDPATQHKDWPHAPIHRLAANGTYFVTAGTLNKERLFRDTSSLDHLETHLLSKAKQYDWHLEAWAVFSNHYHFVSHSLKSAATLKPFLTH